MRGVDYLVGNVRNEVGSNCARGDVFKITAATAEFNDNTTGRYGLGISEQSPVPIVVAASKQRAFQNQIFLEGKKLRRAGFASVKRFFLKPGKHYGARSIWFR